MRSIPEPPSTACQNCGEAVTSIDLECSQCGDRITASRLRMTLLTTRSPNDFQPATRLDVISLIFVALFSVLLTLPSTMLFSNSLWRGQDSEQAIRGVALGVLNVWIWGVPTAMVGWRYREAAQAGVINHSHLIRTFWIFQAAAAFVPTAIFVVGIAVIYLIFSIAVSLWR